jgi:sugar lactone lactonase YvrE
MGLSYGVVQASLVVLALGWAMTPGRSQAMAVEDTITTVAGGGTFSGSGDGGLAVDAAFRPLRTAVDAHGNVYFSDHLARRVHRVDAVTGVVTTAAGNGSAGTGGVGGPAITANLTVPCGLAFNAAGDLYITDRGNPNTDAVGPHRICRVDHASGILTVIAGAGPYGFTGDGGPATAATFNFPTTIALDAQENIYVADQFNHRIRRIDAVTGLISTVVGDGVAGFSGDGGPALLARLNQPNAVGFDQAGNLYIADERNHCIRKVDTNGDIHTVAGTGGSSGFSGDGGSATAAKLNQAGDVAVAANGDFYFPDVGNGRVRMVSGGIISTVAGSGFGGYHGEGGLATLAKLSTTWGVALVTDGTQDLIIADLGNRRLKKVVRATGIIDTIAGGGGLNDGMSADQAVLHVPSDVAVDSAGNRYIIDEVHRIRRIDALTGVITTVAGNGASGFTGDGGQARQARVATPRSVVIDGGGMLYFSDSGNHRVRRIDTTTGIISTIAGTGVAGFNGDGPVSAVTLSSPIGLCLDGANGLHVVDSGNRRLRRIDLVTGMVTTVAGNGLNQTTGDGGSATAASLQTPTDVCSDKLGRLVVCGASLRRIDVGTSTISSLAVGFVASGCVADAYGNVYLADAASDRVARLASDDSLTWVAGNGTAGFSGDDGPAIDASLNGPVGMGNDSGDRLLIADRGNTRIRQVTFTTIPGKPAGTSPTPGSDSSGGGSCGLGGAATTLFLLLCWCWPLGRMRRVP